MTTIKWTHPSVLTLLDETGLDDPFTAIERRARSLADQGLEQGWAGPPYDPFELADVAGVRVVARQDLDDARLIDVEDHRPVIEFNPNRRPARVRFSLAHELGHFLFSDHAEQPRYRDRTKSGSEQRDYWQLEVLCNVAAAELLMPVGAFPMSQTDDLSLPHLLDLRAPFGVSTEALLRRVVKLTDKSACLFAAARLPDDEGFRVDYAVPSRSWAGETKAGDRTGPDSILAKCTAVGYSDAGREQWGDHEVQVQAVGIPPYPGDRFPRVVGLLTPLDDGALEESDFQYVRGDASDPLTDAPVIIAHVVNNQARSWGGRGFAVSLMNRFPDAKEGYGDWASASSNRKLGSTHVAEVTPTLWIASLVAQAGYGDDTGKPRLRLAALRESLCTLASLALERGAEVHMPPIGTGQGGSKWPPIRDLILDELVVAGVRVIVHVLEDEPMPEDVPFQTQLTLA